MAISIKTVADKTFNLLKGYGFSIDTFNKVGEVVGDPSEAIRFFVEDPNLLVTLNIPDEEIRLSISKNTEQTDKLRKQLENLGKDYLMNLDFRVFGRTLKPSSDSVDVAKETNMKETNELRKLAGLPLKEEEDIESKLKTAIAGTQYTIDEYEEKMAELEADPEFQKLDDGEKDDWMWNATDGINLQDEEDKKMAFEYALADHYENGTTHWWQGEIGGGLDTAVRDEIAQDLRVMGAWMGDLEESNELRKLAGTPELPMKEEEDKNMYNELRIDDNTYISDGNKEITPDEVGPGFYILGYDRDGRCFEMSKTSKENAKNHITGYGEYKVSDADITDFDGARYYYNDNMSDGGILHIKSLSGVKAVSENESISEATLGAVHGSLKTSYQPLDNVKLVVKHSKPVNEEVRGARSRNISKIFIQANEERFYFPSKNLQGARAMARHIYNGGVMHDTVGESIVQMCKDFGTLKEFVRYVNKQGLINEDNQEYVTLARQQMDNIRTSFKRVAGVKTYSKAVESITDESNIDIVTEVNLADHFTETHFDDKVGNAHETLSKLVNRKNAFEQYIMTAIENENFANAKELIQEEPIEFENPHQRLGYQVGQLSSCVQDSKLANYLGGIGNKLSTGGQLDAMEYRAVKASLLSAQRPQQTVMATEMSLAESTKYQKFIESFDVEV